MEYSTGFDIVFVGGGPACFGVLTNAYRNNKLDEMFKNNKVAIIEWSDSFGGGDLINFGINSNTSGDGFLRCMF